jgi:transposase-like protein
MNETTLKWIEAAKTLASDPLARVKCPRCEQDYLVVFDVAEKTRGAMIERYLVCPNCKASNVMRMERKEDQKGMTLEITEDISLEEIINRVLSLKKSIN